MMLRQLAVIGLGAVLVTSGGLLGGLTAAPARMLADAGEWRGMGILYLFTVVAMVAVAICLADLAHSITGAAKHGFRRWVLGLLLGAVLMMACFGCSRARYVRTYTATAISAAELARNSERLP